MTRSDFVITKKDYENRTLTIRDLNFGNTSVVTTEVYSSFNLSIFE